MIATLYDNKWVYLSNITDLEDQVLWEKFSIVDKNGYVDSSYGSMWDGVHRKYNRAKKRLARPYLSILRSVCTLNNLPLVVVDERKPWSYSVLPAEEVNPNMLFGITLEDYQMRAIRKCCEVECGIIELPTGAGKGEVICGICKAIQCPTVILADQRVVVDQLKKRLELRDVDDDIGMFYAGKKPNGQTIIVGLIQSLVIPSKVPVKPEAKDYINHVAYQEYVEFARNNNITVTAGPEQFLLEEYNDKIKKWESQVKGFKTRVKNVKKLREYIKSAEMIIVDECDKATSKSFKNLFKNHFNGRRRYGLSATPLDPERPVESMTIQEHLGSIIVKENRQAVLDKGRISDIHYKMLYFEPFGSINESSTYDEAYNDYIINCKQLHRLIGGICYKFRETGGSFILVDRQELGNNLEKWINSLGITAKFICGTTSKKIRAEVLHSFEKRELNVLIGGKIVNRGLDLSGGCERLFIISSTKYRADLFQRIGRAFRINQKRHSVVYDIFFRCNKHLYDHAKRKLAFVVKSGMRCSVIFPKKIISGDEFINKYRYRVDRKWIK